MRAARTARARTASLSIATPSASDRLTVQRLVPHLAQLRRNALARRTYPALLDSTAAARVKVLRLTPRERVVLARAAAGETNTVIAQALFVSPGTIRKHLEHI
jgi:DNA-binding NarL/FixJ family response regulator